MEQPNAIASSSTRALPKEVHALYRLAHPCGTGERDALCAVLSADLSIHDLHAIFAGTDVARLQIVWSDAEALTKAVSVPLRAHLGERSAEFQRWQQGDIAQQLLDASPLLTSDEKQLAAVDILQTAACALGVTDSLVDTLIALDAQLPDHTAPTTTNAPECLPQLIAVYEEIDTAILIVRDAHSLAEIDWSAVRAHFSQFSQLLLTTTKQANLLAQTTLAVAFAIGRYRHHWGVDLTADLNVPTRTYVLNAAQTIVDTYTKSLPRGVMVSAEADLGTLIHDVQNQLLKAQFQYELLNMITTISKSAAPRLHADRTLPFRKRIDTLVEHLRRWVALYTALLDEFQ